LISSWEIVGILVQVLLRNPRDENVVPFLEELCRRLPVNGVSDHLGLNEYEGEGKELEKSGKDNSWSPRIQDHNDSVPGSDGAFTEEHRCVMCSFEQE